MSGGLGSVRAGISGLSIAELQAQFLLSQWDESDGGLIPDRPRAPYERAFDRGCEAYAKHQFDVAVDEFGESVRLKPDFAKAHNNLGCALGEIGKDLTAIETFDKANALDLGQALYNKGVALGRLGRSEDAIAAYDDVVRRFASADELSLRDLVANALINKGVRLSMLGRNEDAVAVFDDVLSRLASATELSLRELVAWALFNKGGALYDLGRLEDAIAVYDNALRLSSTTGSPLRNSYALNNKGIALEKLGRAEDAIGSYDDVVGRFALAVELPLREQVARALLNKASALYDLGRSNDAIATYDGVLRRFRLATELPLREQLATALHNKGFILGLLGRSEDAIAVYDEALHGFASATELPLRRMVARALVNKGGVLSLLERNNEAIAVFDDVLRRFASADEWQLREMVAMALINKGARLSALGHDDEALAVYDEVVARFASAEEQSLREMVARAIVRKGAIFANFGEFPQALAAFEHALNLKNDDEIRQIIKMAVEQANVKHRENSVPESISTAYTGNDMRDMAAQLAVVAESGLSAVELQQAIDLWKATQGGITDRSKPERGEASPRLKWGTDNRTDENPAAFAWRAYQAEAKAGTLHMGLIRQDDRRNGTELAVKLVSWLRSPANRQQVPEGFDIPTKPEWLKRHERDPIQLPPRTEDMRRYTRASVRRTRAQNRQPT